MSRLLVLAWLLLWGLLAGCGNQGPQCETEADCGFAQSCMAGACVTQRCATSVQCPMEHYCSQGDCLVGCSEHGDCYPGSVCDMDERVCVESGCTETWVDCGFREFCDVATGNCLDAGDLYCRTCSNNAHCGEGNICFAGYCMVNCSGGKECPAAFECLPFHDGFGNIISHHCFTLCDHYEDYDPGGFPQKGQPWAPLPEAVQLHPDESVLHEGF